jgi:hypothetical protein
MKRAGLELPRLELPASSFAPVLSLQDEATKPLRPPPYPAVHEGARKWACLPTKFLDF